MPDKEVVSNGKTFGEGTKLVLNVKTLMYILGVLVIVFSCFYIDMRKRYNKLHSEMKQEVQTEIGHYNSNVTDIKTNVTNMNTVVNQNAINIGILLDRSSGNRDAGTSKITPAENIPTTINEGN